jgi:hypothetical protein
MVFLLLQTQNVYTKLLFEPAFSDNITKKQINENGEELSKWMRRLMTSHVPRYHRHCGSGGHVWQGRYKSFMIEEDSHLLMAMRYIDALHFKRLAVFL